MVFLADAFFFRGARIIYDLWVNLHSGIIILITIVLIRKLVFESYRGFSPNAIFFTGAHVIHTIWVDLHFFIIIEITIVLIR